MSDERRTRMGEKIDQERSVVESGQSTYQRAIAASAVSFIEEGMTVYIGASSIHLAMLPYLPSNLPFTVVTNCLEVAMKLKEKETIQVYMVGGKVMNSGVVTDTLANESVKSFMVDLSFAMAEGISAKGLSVETPDVAIFQKTILDHSKKVVALMEHTQFGNDKFAGIYPIQQVDVIITDEETSDDDVDQMMGLGAKVIIADNKY